MSIDTTILNDIIIGRVEPHIYAFTTNTVPNYLKVGDTYRPVHIRLKEWQAHYPNLVKQLEELAVIDDSYFRDYAVHQFLEANKHKIRLQVGDLPAGVFYSREFFKNTTVTDVEEAIEDIKSDYRAGTQKYQYYNVDSHQSEEFTFVRNQDFDLRPNQKTTVEKFSAARKNGRTNLLMYAVMRFGKSFTAMCCAVEMCAKLVVVTSAKADVMLEWKKTVESHVKFANYDFIDSKNLVANKNAISDKLRAGRKVVVFLTLQDLQGDTIKEKHSDLFTQEIDLLLIDETHFGARAEKYGEVLKSHGLEKDIDEKLSQEETLTLESYNEIINKELDAKIRIHLSGTPYKILMGSEFSEEDRIAFYQFTDIVQDQETWDKEHVLDDDYKEWDNPYYGFPQMVRFAFNPNESSRKRLEELRQNGVTYAFSALLKPQSVRKTTDGKHKKFVYEQEVLDLLQVIDGSKADDALLGFIDYDKIKSGKMCRHMVVVLPYCASCDALESLITANRDIFKNLNEYEIINISGVDSSRIYKTPDIIKQKIKECEIANKKTITLTVNRMLTGSTVPEWDTMLYLKDTASPQEYDQAIFRLQNQYIKTYVDSNGDTIKYNMKPQTLLVDFDPNRMFIMQEKKSQIYNVNIDESGNSRLRERLAEELRISPIVCLNKDKIVQVKATDILEAVSNYKKDKGIKEEALDTPVDLDILKYDIVKRVIEQENEIGSKSGLSVPAHKSPNDDDGDIIDVPTPEDSDDATGSSSRQSSTNIPDDKKERISFTKKIQSYYTKILLFAFITNDYVISVKDIIDKIDSSDNARIAKNLGLDKTILTFFNNHNRWVLRQLDYKIQDLNGLSHDQRLSPIEKADIAVHKFGKLGDAIVITPSHICDDMVNLLPDAFMLDIVSRNGRILDIAGTSGEFAAAIYRRMMALGIDNNVIANSIYTIPKSSICYELTRKLYSMLELNVDNIAARFIATDLLEWKIDNEIDYDKINKLLSQNKKFSDISLADSLIEGDEMITFDAIVGNPPYQEIVGNANTNKSLGKQLFPSFIMISSKLSKLSSLITPSKWFTGNGQDGSFPKLREYVKTNNHFNIIVNHLHNDIFPEISIGSLSYYLYDKDYVGDVEFVEVQNGDKRSVVRPLFEEEMDNILSMNIMHSFIEKVCKRNDFTTITTITTGRNPFKVPDSNDRLNRVIQKEKDNEHSIKIYCAYGGTFYISPSNIMRNDGLISKWKIFISKMNGGAGTIFEGKQVNIIGESFIGEPSSVCSGALISIGRFETKKEALNLQIYLKTKFCRFMIGLMKSSQALYQVVYQYVPMQDFTDNSIWSKSISKIDKAACKKYGCKTINEIDAQLYKKYNFTAEEVQFIESTIKPMG